MNNLEHLIADKKIAQEPIYLPDHPYFAKLKDLGVDELIAAFVDPISTTVANGIVSQDLKPYILPITGPITEKLTFFIRHGLEARKIYNTTSPTKRKEYSYYLKDGLKHGASNMTKDIIYHDPMYISLMSFGMAMFPQIPPGIISSASYFVSVLAAVGLDVGIDEFKHYNNNRKLKNAGFQSEKYFESRFCISTEKHPSEVLEGLMKEFNILDVGTTTYRDKYFDINNQGYSGRDVKMRIRTRDKLSFEKDAAYLGKFPSSNFDSETLTTLQIIYTRAREHKSGLDQFRYFPVKKEKIYAVLDSPINSLEDISDVKIKSIAQNKLISNKTYNDLSFERTVAKNDELAVCTDKITSDRSFYVLELKAYNDTKLLMQAMRYLMIECPLPTIQTTYGKSDLLI